MSPKVILLVITALSQFDWPDTVDWVASQKSLFRMQWLEENVRPIPQNGQRGGKIKIYWCPRACDGVLVVGGNEMDHKMVVTDRIPQFPPGGQFQVERVIRHLPLGSTVKLRSTILNLTSDKYKGKRLAFQIVKEFPAQGLYIPKSTVYITPTAAELASGRFDISTKFKFNEPGRWVVRSGLVDQNNTWWILEQEVGTVK